MIIENKEMTRLLERVFVDYERGCRRDLHRLNVEFLGMELDDACMLTDVG